MDFKNLKFLSRGFCGFVCFLVQNFAEIRKSVDELWPKKRLSRFLKISIFGHVTNYSICYMYRISSKSDDFSLRYGDLTIFKMAAVRHLGYQKFAIFVTWPLSTCRSASSYKISLKSDIWSMSYGQKAIFKMAVAAIINFKNFNF